MIFLRFGRNLSKMEIDLSFFENALKVFALFEKPGL
jgi:hypothetical protein